MKTIIIGGGGAGISALDTLLKKDNNIEITLIHNENIKPYYRPYISKCFIQKTSEINNFFLKDNQWYSETKNLNFVQGSVIGIDFKTKTVKTKTSEYKYDNLIIASGSHAFNLPTIDINQEGIFNLINIKDVDKIRKYFGKKTIKNAVVIGGGILGCEAAYSLTNLKVSVDLIELQKHLLPRLLTEKSAPILQKVIENHNINVHLKTSVKKISKVNDKFDVFLENNEKISADIVIVAIGVRPNIEFLNKEKINIERGIIVNTKMETSIPNVYAAGDIIEIKPFMTKMIWFPALETGRIAANNILKVEDSFNTNKKYPVLYSSFNINLVMVGSPAEITKNSITLITYNKDDKNNVSFFTYEKNKIIWAIVFNDQTAQQIITKLMYTKEEDVIEEYIKFNKENEKRARK